MKNEGNEMCQAILKQNGKVVPWLSCRPLTSGELAFTNETETRKRREFDAAIKEKLGDSFSLPNASNQSRTCSMKDESNPQGDDDAFDPYFGVEESQNPIPEADCVDATG